MNEQSEPSASNKNSQLPCDAANFSPSPLCELDQWVSAERLIAILWAPESRPSLQWIRKQTKRHMLPHLRRGRLVFYRPRSIIAWFKQRESKPASMRTEAIVTN